ncbi:MAG: hypothetical protein LC104_12480 [Bacteroidales bacterium]|nr:hypothetical protein [Bacteroidales bacterium]
MPNRKPEIAPAEYYDFIIDLLSCNDGVLPMTKVFDAIERFYGRHFSSADKRMMTMRQGGERPKWKNNVDWAKAIGAKQGVLATVTHKGQKWLVRLEEADDFWVKKAQKKKKKRSFKKKCPNCNFWCKLGDKKCESCGFEFPPVPEKRLID